MTDHDRDREAPEMLGFTEGWGRCTSPLAKSVARL